MKLIEIILVICILTVLTKPVSSSGLEIDLKLEKKLVYSGDELGGTFYLENNQNKFINLYYARILLKNSSSKTVQESIVDLSVIIPPSYSDSIPVSFTIPDVPEGNYIIRFELNHSQGISTVERQIIIKSKKILAEQEIEKVERIVNELYGANLSAEGERYLLKAKKSLNKSKSYYYEGMFSSSYDYARIAMQYAKIAAGETELKDTIILPNKSQQHLINYTEIENMLKKIKETKNYTQSPPKLPQIHPESNILEIILFAVIGVNVILVMILLNKYVIKKK